MNVHISPGNRKLGSIPNVSMPPIAACNHSAPCRAKDQCNMVKFMRPMFRSVRSAWMDNHRRARTEPGLYFAAVDAYLKLKEPRYFRWHVSGDILDQPYLNSMKRVARNNPGTAFLAYTKMYGLDYRRLPGNLTIVWSAWPGMDLPKRPRNIRVAWLRTDPRAPTKNAIECGEHCEPCGKKCWHLPKLGVDVVFHWRNP